MADVNITFDGEFSALRRDLVRFRRMITGAFTGITAPIFAIAGFAGLANMLKSATQAANEQALADSKLQGALIATGGAANLTMRELKDMGEELASLTFYTDDAINSMQAILLTFKSIEGQTFERATRAALDLSALFGQDLRSSAVQLGKALEDPVRGMNAMARVGVSFSEAQREMIKGFAEQGEMIEAQNIILEAVEGQVSGIAALLRDTTAGEMKELNEQWGEVLEDIGQAANVLMDQMLPSLIDMVKTMRDYTEEWTKWIEGYSWFWDWFSGDVGNVPTGAFEKAIRESFGGALEQGLGSAAREFTRIAGDDDRGTDGFESELVSLTGLFDAVQKGIMDFDKQTADNTGMMVDQLAEINNKMGQGAVLG